MRSWHTWHALLVVAVPCVMGACDSPCSFTQPEPDPALGSAGAGGGTAGGGVAGAGGGVAGAGGGQGGTGGSVGGSGGVGGVGEAVTVVKNFDAAAFELAEGLAIDSNSALVGFAPLGKVVKVNLQNQMVADFGTVTFAPNSSYLLGLAIDSQKGVYGAVADVGAGSLPGIYKWTSAGGAAVPFATNAAMTKPNGLVFDAAGSLFVADSTGTIFKISSDGLAVTAWKSDPLLVGAMECGVTPFPIGANGIVFDAAGTTMYVANTNKGSIVKIVVNGDGSAGEATNLAGPNCVQLGGADGIALDGTTLYVALNGQNRIATVSTADGKVANYSADKLLQSPASVAIDAKTLYATNAAFGMNQTPGLVSLPIP